MRWRRPCSRRRRVATKPFKVANPPLTFQFNTIAHRLSGSCDMPSISSRATSAMVSVRAVPAPVTKVTVPVQSRFSVMLPAYVTPGRKNEFSTVASNWPSMLPSRLTIMVPMAVMSLSGGNGAPSA